ncbi:MAG TPA: low affinity iron permease family protein [Hanamia sp.]
MKSISNKEPQEQKENPKKNKLSSFFNRFSAKITKITGGVYAFIVAIIVVIIWAATGPVFKFSDTWQLVINTGTTIITFLMVFIIQHSQNKDTIALQLKLNELIAASTASNKLICIEDLTDEKLEEIKKFYAGLSEDTKKEKNNKIHSLEESNTGIESEINGKV